MKSGKGPVVVVGGGGGDVRSSSSHRGSSIAIKTPTMHTKDGTPPIRSRRSQSVLCVYVYFQSYLTPVLYTLPVLSIYKPCPRYAPFFHTKNRCHFHPSINQTPLIFLFG